LRILNSTLDIFITSMELSRYLQSPELLSSIASMHPDVLRDVLLGRTRQWYAEHADARQLIESNLHRLGSVPGTGINAFIDHVGLHYFEKLLALCLGAEKFRSFLDTHVDTGRAVSMLETARSEGKAVLCAAPHFGAVEFIAPSLASRGFELTAALRFKTEQLSQAAHAHAQAFAASGLFAAISFIEVGKPGTHAALDMAAVLRRKSILLTVFDEKTDYSVPVQLFSTQVWGGAGLDKLLTFCGVPTAVFAAFMVRLSGGKYRLDLEQVRGEPNDAITGMYARLEEKARRHTEQWYFLHEEIPFIDGTSPDSAGAAV